MSRQAAKENRPGLLLSVRAGDPDEVGKLKKARLLILITMLILSADGGVYCSTPTNLISIRFGDHSTFTRLVFDVQGDRPIRVGRPKQDTISIDYKGFRTKVEASKLPYSDFRFVSRVSFKELEHGKSIIVSCKPNTSINYFFLDYDPPRSGWYRLVMDFSSDIGLKRASGKPIADRRNKAPDVGESSRVAVHTGESAKLQKASSLVAVEAASQVMDAETTGEPTSLLKNKKKEIRKLNSNSTQDLKEAEEKKADIAGDRHEPSEVTPSDNIKEKPAEKLRTEAGRKVQPGAEVDLDSYMPEQSTRSSVPAVVQESNVSTDPNKLASDLTNLPMVERAKADGIAAYSQEDSQQNPLDVIRKCEEAIRANPRSTEAPCLFYRCAVAYGKVGDSEKAGELIKNVISDYPGHAVVPFCWLELGRMQLKHNDFVDAIASFRMALSFPLDQDSMVEAHYLLARAFTQVDAYQDAIDSFRKCLSEDPKAYLKRPDLLKYLGQSLFATARYSDSYKYLFQYVNLEENVSERDMVLARIADALQHEGEQKLADKIYSYIAKEFPGSEGDIIGHIRKAESLEQKSADEAHRIYKELAERPLSIPLMKVVYFKLADWEWQHQNYQQGLSLIDKILQGRNNLAEYDEFLTLKTKVVQDWAEQAFRNKNYIKVVELYSKYGPVFEEEGGQDLTASVAESYGELKVYPTAIQIYRSLLSSSTDKRDDWLFKIARYEFLAGDLKTAEEHLAQVHSNNIEPQKSQLLAEINFTRGDFQKAVEQYEKCLASEDAQNSVDLPVLFHLAESLIKTNRSKDALDYLGTIDKRLKNGGSEQKVYLCLLQSECYEALKQPEQAAEILEQAIILNPSDELKGRLNYQLSELYAKAGQNDMAVKKLKEMLKSPQPFWKTAAQQRLDYLDLQSLKAKSTAF